MFSCCTGKGQTTIRRCPRPPQTGREARTTPHARHPAERPQPHVQNFPSSSARCRSSRQTGSSNGLPSPAPRCLYELHLLARPLASCLSTSRGRLHRAKFVVPVKLDASVLESHVHRQVVGMPEGSLYHADAALPGSFTSVQHSHRRAYTCLVRFQEVCPLSRFTV